MSEIEDKIAECDEKIKKLDEEIAKLTRERREIKELKEKLVDKKFYQKSTQLQSKTWDIESFPWSVTLREKLSSTFGFSEFRSQQLQTINVILSKHDCILVSPTGGGKSLCYQLPAICGNGVTLVISPLISLMEDQIYSLKKRNINAELLSATTEKTTVNAVHKLLVDSSYSCPLKLLYVTPERLAKSKKLMSSLQKCYQFKKLDLIAIDEVHCCSTWGHDFRPDYKFLGTMKMIFPQVPILGVTATASAKVLTDVQKILNIRECLIFKAPFNRPNLYYHLLEKPSEKDQVYDLLADLLKNRFAGQSGIIYTFSIKDTEDITSELLQRDVKVRPYHANLENNVRSSIYMKWAEGSIQAVVATIAFGMGIDKPDVRFVIHHTLSKSMENFYQESGRAGRDGKHAECIVLYRFADIFKISTLTFTEHNGLKNAYSMVNYCINGKKCRRDMISKYFSEVWDDDNCQKMCDNCFYKDSVSAPRLDIINYYRVLCKIIDKAEQLDIKLTGLKLIDAWFHKGVAKLRLEHTSPPAIDRYYGEQVVAYLLTNEYLREDFHYTAYQTISYIQRGDRRPGDELKYVGARIFKLPSIEKLQHDPKRKDSVDLNRSIKSSSSPKKKHRKRRISTSDDDDVSTSNKSIKSESIYSVSDSKATTSSLNKSEKSSVDIEEIINEKVKKEIKKYLIDEIKDKSIKSKLDLSQDDDDDCVVVSEQKGTDIIDID